MIDNYYSKMMSFNIQQSDFGKNGRLINKSGSGLHQQSFSGVEFESGSGLRIDQSPGELSFHTERQKPFDVDDYQYSTIVSNTPSNKDTERTVKGQLSKILEKPEIIYKKVVDDARTLPYISIIEPELSTIYSNIILKNFTNLYIHSPRFYLYIVQSSKNSLDYQKFIYLLIIIKYCDVKKDDEAFLKLDSSIPILVEWCKLKKLPDIDFYIQGPQCPTNYVNSQSEVRSNSDKILIFSDIYSGLISTSNVVDNISNYLQVTEQQNINRNLVSIERDLQHRPNAFDKLLNQAGSYTLSIDTAINCDFKEDENNNLIVNFSKVNLGNSNSEVMNLKINEAEIDSKLLSPEPRISNTKLMNLMNNYTNFNVKNLLVSKQTYKTSLDAFDKLYLVFPGITMDGKFNQVYTTGTLQISGHFITNQNSKYWEFVPDNENGITYNPTTVAVKSTDFYISDCPTSKNSLSYYAFETNVKLDNYYNCPIVVQELSSGDMETYIIKVNSISSGRIQEKSYSFLYNRTIKTIQLLQDNYTYDNIPKSELKGQYKIVEQVEAQYKPVMNVTRGMIQTEVLRAITANSRNQGIILPNNIQPITIEGIKNLQKLDQQSFKYGNQTIALFNSSGIPIDPKYIVQKLNYTTYSLTNPFVVRDLKNQFNQAISKRQASINLDLGNGVIETKSLVYRGTNKLVDYQTFCATYNLIDVEEYVNILYNQIEQNYQLALKTYNSMDHAIVNRVQLVSSPEDFESERAYELFNGWFMPDYDYNMEYSTDITAKGKYINEVNATINNYKYDFYDLVEETEDGKIVFKDYYSSSDFVDETNTSNKIVVPTSLKTITNPIEPTDTASNCFSGSIVGYFNESGNFIERKSYNTTTTELVITIQQPDDSIDLHFENIWRRVVYQSQSDYENHTNNYTMDFVTRTMNYTNNVYKTFKIEQDIFDISMTIDDYIFSYLKMVKPTEIYGKTYVNINELGLSLVTDDTRNTRPGLFDKKVRIKYFINFIEQNKMGLLIHQPNFDFNTLDVMFKNESYILETINNNMFMINYRQPLNGPEVIISKGSRMKIIVEMK